GTGLVGPDVPLLLAGRGGVPAATRRELSRVLPGGSEVVLLGGEQVLPQLVADELEAGGWVPVRVSGPSRIETALAVASWSSLAESDTVLLASADGWVDAVAGGVAAARLGAPVLLTPGDVLHPAVAAHLAALQPTTIVLLGGPAALSMDLEEAVAATTGVTPTRAGGMDRRETAEAIRDLLLDDVAGMTVIDGWDADAWVDGLAAAPLGLPIAIAPESGSATIQSSGVLATRQRVVDAAS
ncbi:MAG: cell wall-binding repeat-containing protein, partial [Actinomycetota bacterium]